MKKHVDVIIVGGGAAGFFAAIQLKSKSPTASVLILEAAAKPLGKVLISGGGRCNVTHGCLDNALLVQSYPRGQKELKGVFHRFSVKDTLAWFESQGVRLKKEADGRMFPTTDQSETIANALQTAARQLGVQIQTQCRVENITRHGAGYLIKTQQQQWQVPILLLATGGAKATYSWLEAMGHSIVAPVPSLFTFHIHDKALTELAGISLPHVSASIHFSPEQKSKKTTPQSGPLLITHWGLSGPVILRLSAWGARDLANSAYEAQLVIDLIPERSLEAMSAMLLEKKQQAIEKKRTAQVGNDFPLDFPKRFTHYLLQHVQIDPAMRWFDVSDKALRRLAETLKRLTLTVKGKSLYKEEFVTAGGVDLKEVNLATLESRQCPGLFFAGELLNVDGLTGGFNFQNAWSTGAIAGWAMAERFDAI